MEWLNALIELAYSAAIDGDLWKVLAEKMAQEMAAFGGTFIVIDSESLEIRNFQSVGGLSGVEDDYSGNGWWQYDPQVPLACGLPRSAIYDDTMFDLPNTEEIKAYRDWERSWGADHHLTSVNLLSPANGLRGCFSFHFGKDGVHQEATQKLMLLSSRLNHALQIGFKHEEALSLEYWRGLSTAGANGAFLLLDERGQIIHLTELAEAMVQQNDGMRIAARSLQCVEPAQNDALESLMRRALSPQPIAGTLLIARPSGRMPYLLTTYPLPKSRRALAPFEAAVLVRLVDTAGKPAAAQALYQNAFGLTKREADLAVAIMAGHSPETAAVALGTSIATVRIHLRRLFHKTRTNRQSDLVRTLAWFR